MEQKVIIAKNWNLTPEEEVNDRLKKLGPGWRIVSATTALCPHGELTEDEAFSMSQVVGRGVAIWEAKHVYYVTTVVVQKD